MTTEQMDVIKFFFNLTMQFILAVASIVIWLVVTIALIFNPHWPLATFDGLLTLTLRYTYGYFFPTSRQRNAVPGKAAAKPPGGAGPGRVAAKPPGGGGPGKAPASPQGGGGHGATP